MNYMIHYSPIINDTNDGVKTNVLKVVVLEH